MGKDDKNILKDINHDTFFKESMKDLDIAKDFFKSHLPAKVLESVDMSTLQVENTHFLNKAIKNRYTDMLYRLKINKRTGYIYVLTEQQTNPDKLMPLRIFEYSFLVMRQHIEKYKNDKLPIVIPLLFYNGKVKYPFSTDVLDLFDQNDRDLAKEVLFKPVQLIDLNEIDDGVIKFHQKASLMELAMKHVWDQRFQPLLGVLAELSIEYHAEENVHYLDILVYYVYSRLDTNNKDEFYDEIKNLPGPLGEKAMTIADYLEERGMERGVERGMEQGIKLKEKEFIEKLIAKNYDNETIIDLTDLSMDEIIRIREELNK